MREAKARARSLGGARPSGWWGLSCLGGGGCGRFVMEESREKFLCVKI